jgi:hypothetical protein
MSTHLGPVDAVEWVVEEFQARTGTRVPLNLPRLAIRRHCSDCVWGATGQPFVDSSQADLMFFDLTGSLCVGSAGSR